MAGPHSRHHPLDDRWRRQRPGGVVHEDDLRLRAGLEHRSQSEGHARLPRAGRAGHDLHRHGTGLPQSVQLRSKDRHLVGRSRDDEVVNDAGVQQAAGSTAQQAHSRQRHQSLGTLRPQARARARCREDRDHGTAGASSVARVGSGSNHARHATPLAPSTRRTSAGQPRHMRVARPTNRLSVCLCEIRRRCRRREPRPAWTRRPPPRSSPPGPARRRGSGEPWRACASHRQTGRGPCPDGTGHARPRRP